jgi:hypothetical protein
MRSIIEPPPLQSQPRINKACQVRVAKLPAGQGANSVEVPLWRMVSLSDKALWPTVGPGKGTKRDWQGGGCCVRATLLKICKKSVDTIQG